MEKYDKTGSIEDGRKGAKKKASEKNYVKNENHEDSCKIENNEVKGHKCDHCEKSFSEREHLKKHIKTIHEEKAGRKSNSRFTEEQEKFIVEKFAEFRSPTIVRRAFINWYSCHTANTHGEIWVVGW